MKISELKKLIKPLVKESVKEILLEEGILSRMIQETIIGVKSADIVLNESKKAAQTQITQQQTEARRAENLEKRKKLLDSIGNEKFGGVDLFEGTSPVRESNTRHGPLRDQDPADSGVDITNIPGMGNWNKLL